ncbi:MAG: hypothetical protein QM820_18825 [Minicystis sp.]
MRTVAAVCAIAAVIMISPSAGADSPPPPPPGWEQPPPLPGPPSGKPAAPACCAYDSVCCERQRAIDAPVEFDHMVTVVDVDVANLPEIEVKTADKDHPGIPGVAPVRAVDGRGRPSPWPDGPQLEMRVMPPGRFGEILWHREWSEPWFADAEYSGMGHGIVLTVGRRQAGAGPEASALVGPVSYVAIDKAPSDRIAYDHVEGVLQGTTAVAATLWEHVEPAPIYDNYLQGWRGKLDESPAVVFLLPEVILGFESRDAKSHGGFFPSRFSRTVAFTRYTLPYGPGRSALVTFEFNQWAGKRWFARPAGAEKIPERRSVALFTSQTAAEAAPRVRVLLFAPRSR